MQKAELLEKIDICSAPYRKMVMHVQSAYPFEACGILLKNTDTGAIADVIPLENAAPLSKKYAHFSVEPRELFRAEQRACELGLEVAGFYHSHPDCGAEPSREDEEHMIPGMLCVIFPVAKGAAGECLGHIKGSVCGPVMPVVVNEVK